MIDPINTAACIINSEQIHDYILPHSL